MGNRALAERLLNTVRSNFVPAHEFRVTDLADHGHLDRAFYVRLSEACLKRGFVLLGDLEDLTMRRQSPDPRTVIRVLSRIEAGVVCAVYHFKPRLLWRLLMLLFRSGPAKLFELETELSDGAFLISTIVSESSKLPTPESVRRFHHHRDEPFERVLAAHERRLSEYRRAHPGVGVVCQASLKDVVASQNRLYRQRHDHLERIGWLPYEYLLQSSRGNRKLAAELQEEVAAILAEEQAPSPAPSVRRMAAEPVRDLDATPDRPVAFGYKKAWLALPSVDASRVRDALGVEEARAANWGSGMRAMGLGHTFIAPTVNGWVLVVGFDLPEASAPAEEAEWNELMSSLSRRFGEAQYFANHRVVGYYVWARFVNGEEQRCFAYSGESGQTLADRGERSEGEQELGYRYFADSLPPGEMADYWDREDLTYPDEEHVLEVAGKWSLDPRSLEELEADPAVGWVVRLRRPSTAEL